MSPAAAAAGAVVGAAAGAVVGVAAAAWVGAVVGAAAGFAAVGCAAGAAAVVGAGAVLLGAPHAASRAALPMASEPPLMRIRNCRLLVCFIEGLPLRADAIKRRRCSDR